MALLDFGCRRDTARIVCHGLAAQAKARAKPISERNPTSERTVDRLVERLPRRNAMPERNWEHEVQQNLQEFERRQASVLHNPSVARLYIERGVGVAVVVVFTCYGSTIRSISQD